MCKSDECGNQFEVLHKVIKFALALIHSNADVERSLSINRRILTKENNHMNDETYIGLGAIKAAIKEFGSVNNISVTFDMVKAAEESCQLYVEHLKQEQLKKKQKAVKKQEQAEKRELREMQTEEKRLHKKLQVLKDEEKVAQEATERAMDYVHNVVRKLVVG